MYDIITFGSAAKDIRIKPKAFKILDSQKEFDTGKGFCFNFGSKIEIEELNLTSGGGGTNTAAAFSKQGFKTAFCGAVGEDIAGEELTSEMKKLKIDTRFIVKKSEKPTNHSIVISSDGQERTILVYRGASDLLTKNDIPWSKLKAKWFYLAPFASPKPEGVGGLGIFEEIISFAEKNNIKIACNPSKQQLSLPEDQLKRIFQKIDVLFLNQEEASFLTKISYEEETENLKKIGEICHGVIVITKGGAGVVASDGKFIYSALPQADRKIVDTTGAGDSFASGFLSDYIRYSGDIEKAIQLGLANSAANLAEIGAKAGLLDKNSKFERVTVTKNSVS